MAVFAGTAPSTIPAPMDNLQSKVNVTPISHRSLSVPWDLPCRTTGVFGDRSRSVRRVSIVMEYVSLQQPLSARFALCLLETSCVQGRGQVPAKHQTGRGYCLSNIPPTCRPGRWQEPHCVVDDDTPDCRDGVRNGNDCMTTTTPVCHPGTHLSGDVCVSNKPPTCEGPAVLDKNGNCITTIYPRCSNGKLKDGKCVTADIPNCDDGSHLVNGKCESLIRPNCETGFILRNGRCIRTSERQDCKAGYTFKNGECVSLTEPDCPDGMNLNGDSCVSKEHPACPPGTRLEGDDCVSNSSPQCPDGLRLHNNRCISTRMPSCPDGTRLERSTRECVSVEKPKCGDGQVYKNGSCVLGSGKCVEYQFCPTGAPITDGFDSDFTGNSDSGFINLQE